MLEEGHKERCLPFPVPQRVKLTPQAPSEGLPPLSTHRTLIATSLRVPSAGCSLIFISHHQPLKCPESFFHTFAMSFQLLSKL